MGFRRVGYEAGRVGGLRLGRKDLGREIRMEKIVPTARLCGLCLDAHLRLFPLWRFIAALAAAAAAACI